MFFIKTRYCYAGLRKKVKLEVPQLPNLGESTKVWKNHSNSYKICISFMFG